MTYFHLIQASTKSAALCDEQPRQTNPNIVPAKYGVLSHGAWVGVKRGKGWDLVFGKIPMTQIGDPNRG